MNTILRDTARASAHITALQQRGLRQVYVDHARLAIHQVEEQAWEGHINPGATAAVRQLNRALNRLGVCPLQQILATGTATVVAWLLLRLLGAPLVPGTFTAIAVGILVGALPVWRRRVDDRTARLRDAITTLDKTVDRQ